MILLLLFVGACIAAAVLGLMAYYAALRALIVWLWNRLVG